MDEHRTNWPIWFAPAGLLLALACAGLGAGLADALAEAGGLADHHQDHLRALGATVVQDVALIGVALLLARTLASATPSDFGLRPIPAARLWLSAAAALVAFLIVTVLWTVLVDRGEQETLETFGVGESDGYLWGSALLVIVLGPFAEEFFFRGFCFRAVRNRFSFAVASVSTSLVFASLHYSGGDTLVLIPPLAFLGVMFCWLYERTGSLWPSVVFHMLNNAIAFSATADTEGAVLVGAAVAALGAALFTATARPRRSSPR